VPQLIEAGVAKDGAILRYQPLPEIHPGIGWCFDLRLDDQTAANQIDNVAELGVPPHRELGAGEVAQRAIDGLVIVQVGAGKMEDAVAIFQFEKIMRTLCSKAVHTKSAIGAEAGGLEKASDLEFFGKAGDHKQAA